MKPINENLKYLMGAYHEGAKKWFEQYGQDMSEEVKTVGSNMAMAGYYSGYTDAQSIEMGRYVLLGSVGTLVGFGITAIAVKLVKAYKEETEYQKSKKD